MLKNAPKFVLYNFIYKFAQSKRSNSVIQMTENLLWCELALKYFYAKSIPI